MKQTLNYLFEHKTLSYNEAREILTGIAGGKYNEYQITAFLAVYIMRNITIDEFMGFRDALLDLCVKTDLSDYDPIDLCGTGGDGKDTFNISTLASFVTAGAGVKVAKHGNNGVSSACGSSNVMAHFGYKFTNDADLLRKQMDVAGICFLHAPLFHPAMKTVAPIRRNLGVKTFFNMLGPIVNPSFPKKQIAGVFNLSVARLYKYLYEKTDKQFIILHSLDGYDEVSLTGDFKYFSNTTELTLSPKDLGLKTYRAEQLYGGNSVAEAAAIFINILENKSTEAQRDAVIANAAIAIKCAKPDTSLIDSVAIARESLISGNALSAFRKLIDPRNQ